MVAIAKKHNSAAKFSGSGGAVVGLCRDPADLPALQDEMRAEGCVRSPLLARCPGAVQGSRGQLKRDSVVVRWCGGIEMRSKGCVRSPLLDLPRYRGQPCPEAVVR
jgi:hypothetical protein